MKSFHKKLLLLGIVVVLLIIGFQLTQRFSNESLQNLGVSMPLPLFTVLIALVDGFNPCNFFVLTMLVSLMVSESHSRKRILAVGFTFVGVVYVFYFFFMATWLNIMKYVGFIAPLRFGIATLAVFAGFINIKELFFYRKGITLMVQDKQLGPLKKKIAKVAKLVKTGSFPTLIGASITLAIFASLVELPCTAGFPIVYTGVLTGAGLANSFGYYLFLALYNLIYVTPLIVLISVLGFTFKGKPIAKDKMAIIKFIGGTIMLILGLILFLRPALIGIGY